MRNFLTFPEKLGISLYLIFIVWLHFAGGVQVQRWDPESVSIFLLGIPSVFLLLRVLGIFTASCRKIHIAINFILLLGYVLLGFYHLRARTGLEFSIMGDNISLLFYEESSGVLLSSFYFLDYLLIFLFIITLIFLQIKFNKIGPTIYRRKWIQFAITLPIYLTLIFASRFIYEEYGMFFKTVIKYFKEGESSLILPKEQFPYDREFVSVRSSKRPHIFVITVESFNGNFVNSKNENGMEYTPFINSLIPKGWYFDNFYGQSVQTSKGQLAAYCSMIPLTRKKVFKHYARIRVRCLPHVLEENGYTNFFFKGYSKIKFDNTGVFAKQMGFEHIHGMSKRFISEEEKKKYYWGWGVQDNIFYKKFFEYVDEVHKEKGDNLRVFAGLTTISNHIPFKVPERLRKLFKNPKTSKEKYANSIWLTDQYISDFFKELKSRDYLKDSIVIITGDHSYPMGEHKSYTNVRGAYEETFKVPLIVVGPSIESRRFEKPYSQLDLAPTLMDLLGITSKAPFLGESILKGGEREIPLVQPYDGTYLSIIIHPYKFVFHQKTGAESCFDLASDPLETTNIIEKMRGRDHYRRFKEGINRILVNDVLIHKNRIWHSSR